MNGAGLAFCKCVQMFAHGVPLMPMCLIAFVNLDPIGAKGNAPPGNSRTEECGVLGREHVLDEVVIWGRRTKSMSTFSSVYF